MSELVWVRSSPHMTISEYKALRAAGLWAEDHEANVVDEPGVPDEPIWRLSVAQYHAMIAADILVDGDPLELLEGWLVYKPRKTPQRSFTRGMLDDLVKPLLPRGWFGSTIWAITLTDSEPEPDYAVMVDEPREYLDHFPGAGEVALVVEVADVTLLRAQGMKKRIYARGGVPIYWIVNLVERRIEVYSEPSGPTDAPDYGHRQDYGPTDTLPLLIAVNEVGRLTVADLLP